MPLNVRLIIGTIIFGLAQLLTILSLEIWPLPPGNTLGALFEFVGIYIGLFGGLLLLRDHPWYVAYLQSQKDKVIRQQREQLELERQQKKEAEESALKAKLDAIKPVNAPAAHPTSPLSPAAQKIAAEIARRRGQ